jgi:hypothetical protein
MGRTIPAGWLWLATQRKLADAHLTLEAEFKRRAFGDVDFGLVTQGTRVG